FGIDGSANKDWMKQWPELSKPLGPPKGPAHQSGYLYRRSFQNAEVEVNIEDETATIHWIAPK
ncbi:hypothetical protein N9132_01270, partial [bacterium]|nr:hypothetical protein [bacterium]